MVTLFLFVVGASMIVAAGFISFRLWRASTGRSELAGDLDRMLSEVDRALDDPVLIMQAVRRVRRRHSHDV
jgi:hypothetical protein